jgi:hypothetical protein
MAPVTVANITFSSKAALTTHVRQLLSQSGPTPDLQKHDPAMYTFILGLLQRHPNAAEKLRGESAIQVSVIEQPYAIDHLGQPSHSLLLHYLDGSMDDISWRFAVSGKQSKNAGKSKGVSRLWNLRHAWDAMHYSSMGGNDRTYS